MSNGSQIVLAEAEKNIVDIEHTEPPAMKSNQLCFIMRSAVVRSLRMCISTHKASTKNTYLLLLLIVVSIKVDSVGVIDLIAKLIKALL